MSKVRDKKALSSVNCDLKTEGAAVDGCWQHAINVFSVLELFQERGCCLCHPAVSQYPPLLCDLKKNTGVLQG